MGSIEQVPHYRRAIVVDSSDNTHAIRENVPLPTPQPDEFIIRTDAIAINPSDLKRRGPFVVRDGILGIDCAGTVISVGSNVTDLKPGDRVCGPQHSMHAHSPHYGAFTDYAVCSGKVWMKVPENISIEGAASLGAGISTAGLGIKLLGLPLPDAPISQEKKVYVLVYGGATATGTLAIQLLKVAGFVPIATCSPKSKELVTTCGAEATFDYRSPSCASDIKSHTTNNLRYALDCITTHDSTTCCLAAIGRAGGKYVSLDPVVPGAPTRITVKTDWVLGPSIFGQGSTWPAPYGREPDEELRNFGEHLWTLAATLIKEGKLNHHPLLVLEGGLEKVLEGMDLVAKGKLSGEKCVVRLSSS